MTNQSCPSSNQNNRRSSFGRPLVSIGMPVYDGERFVRQALESFLVQDYGNFELIISDNASTDTTGNICQRYARIRYVRNETNLGACPNHKRVFEMARGDYFKWAAHDDECLPTFLGRCMSVFEEAPQSVVLVYPQSLIIDEEGRVIEEYRVSIEAKASRPHRRLASVLRYVMLGTPAYGVMRANALKLTRLIDAFLSSDYVLFAELAMLGEIWETPEPLLRKRFHPARSIVAHQTAQDYEAWLDTRRPRRRRVLSRCHKLAFEYLRSAWHLPLGPYERMMCSATGLYYHYRKPAAISGAKAGAAGNRSMLPSQAPYDRIFDKLRPLSLHAPDRIASFEKGKSLFQMTNVLTRSSNRQNSGKINRNCSNRNCTNYGSSEAFLRNPENRRASRFGISVSRTI
jgi:glycosyltransferase involved in cell wall biosynthesis